MPGSGAEPRLCLLLCDPHAGCAFRIISSGSYFGIRDVADMLIPIGRAGSAGPLSAPCVPFARSRHAPPPLPPAQAKMASPATWRKPCGLQWYRLACSPHLQSSSHIITLCLCPGWNRDWRGQRRPAASLQRYKVQVITRHHPCTPPSLPPRCCLQPLPDAQSAACGAATTRRWGAPCVTCGAWAASSPSTQPIA